MGLISQQHVGSSRIRDWTHVPCIGFTTGPPGKSLINYLIIPWICVKPNVIHNFMRPTRQQPVIMQCDLSCNWRLTKGDRGEGSMMRTKEATKGLHCSSAMNASLPKGFHGEFHEGRAEPCPIWCTHIDHHTAVTLNVNGPCIKATL